MIRLTWQQVCARRLERHGLWRPAGAEAELPPGADAVADVVSAMCGAHAQVASAAELSIGLRVPGATRTHVRQAVWTDRTLVKTRGPRGTVHLLAAADLPMWTGALSAMPPPPYEQSRDALLTPAQTEQVLAAIADALRDVDLTTTELTDAVVARTGPWAGDRVMDAFQDKWPRWIIGMAAAMRRGVMCFGPSRGRAITYTSPARWLPAFAPMDGRSALAELLRRYLYSYGPATSAHVAQWLSAPRTWAAQLFESLDLEPVTVEGEQLWVVAGDTEFSTDLAPGLWLLPYFDAYAVGCHPRELLFPGIAAERALARGQAGNFPVLVVDGTVAGVWHQRRSGRTIHITVEPVAALNVDQRLALDEQVDLVGHVLEGTPALSIGTVNVGPHA
jgi:Winged helix DNA-binding domain